MAWSIKSIFCCVSVLSSSSIDNQPHFRPASNTSGQSVLIKKETQELLDRMPIALEDQGFRRYPLEIKKIIFYLRQRDNYTYLDLKGILDKVVEETSNFYRRIAPTARDAQLRNNDVYKNVPALLDAIASYLKIEIPSTVISMSGSKKICISVV